MRSFSILIIFSLALLLAQSRDSDFLSRKVHEDSQHRRKSRKKRHSNKHHWRPATVYHNQHRGVGVGKPGKHWNEVDMALYFRSSYKSHGMKTNAEESSKKVKKLGMKQIQDALYGKKKRESSTSSKSSDTSARNHEASSAPRIEDGVLNV